MIHRSMAFISLCLLAFPSFAQFTSSPAEVVDSQGLVIGPVADFEGISAVVSLDVQGQIVPAVVFRNHITVTHNFAVYFASNDCTGTAFTIHDGHSVFVPSAIVGPSNALYMGPMAVPSPLQYASRLAAGSSGCEARAGQLSTVLPVQFVTQLTPPFQPPFSVQRAGFLGAANVPSVQTWGLVALAALLTGGAMTLLHRNRAA